MAKNASNLHVLWVYDCFLLIIMIIFLATSYLTFCQSLLAQLLEPPCKIGIVFSFYRQKNYDLKKLNSNQGTEIECEARSMWFQIQFSCYRTCCFSESEVFIRRGPRMHPWFLLQLIVSLKFWSLDAPWYTWLLTYLPLICLSNSTLLGSLKIFKYGPVVPVGHMSLGAGTWPTPQLWIPHFDSASIKLEVTLYCFSSSWDRRNLSWTTDLQKSGIGDSTWLTRRGDTSEKLRRDPLRKNDLEDPAWVEE